MTVGAIPCGCPQSLVVTPIPRVGAIRCSSPWYFIFWELPNKLIEEVGGHLLFLPPDSPAIESNRTCLGGIKT